MNDATGLIAYGYAVAAVATGVFNFKEVNDEALRKIENELDLEETRLILEKK